MNAPSPKSSARVLHLTPVVSLRPEAQMQLLDVRNEDSVRKAMFTDHVISADEHRSWIAALKKDSSRRIWALVNADDRVIGQVGLSRIDPRQGTADWAFYLASSERGGLGFAVEFALLDLAFGPLGIEKLNCEVVEGNAPVLKLHSRFGFREEGMRRSQIRKGNRRVGVHLLGMMREEWQVMRESIATANAAMLGRFSMVIDAGSIK